MPITSRRDKKIKPNLIILFPVSISKRPMLTINENIMYGRTVICNKPIKISPGIDIQPTSSPKNRPRKIPAKTPIKTLVERDRFFRMIKIIFLDNRL